ncbi:MAG: hypothetical protein Q9M94_00015 [Candidatus Gracilibacteria bacterium]|nr:hypothetical protein [Candidatus Gracilibacteria bacterium]
MRYKTTKCYREDYLENIKKNKLFEFIKDEDTKDTLYLFFSYSYFMYTEEILINKGIDESLLELKIHTVIIYLGSIIEAVLYDFVYEKLKNNEKSRKKYLEIDELIKVQKIKETENLYISRLEKKIITLNDSINFNALINGAKDKSIINEEIINKINTFRKRRNSIHINVYKIGDFIKLDELEKSFIETKEILDYLEENI